jgi:hypothetical protein
MLTRLFCALAVFAAISSAADAATQTFRIQGSFGAGQLLATTFDVILTRDFPGTGIVQEVPVDSAVLTSLALPNITPADVGGVGYTYFPNADALRLGGLAPGNVGGNSTIAVLTTDFLFDIANFTTAPTATNARDSRAGRPGTGSPDVRSLIVTNITGMPPGMLPPLVINPPPVSTVPLPSPALLLLCGLGLLALRSRGKSVIQSA